MRYDQTLLTQQDIYLFNEGTHYRLHDKLGAHILRTPAGDGTLFAVWAPNAEAVSVMGDFNGWDKDQHPLRPRDSSGIWEGFLPGLGRGSSYKFHIRSRYNGYSVDKADPYAFATEVPPRTASIVQDLDYTWHDQSWMAGRRQRNSLQAPISIYEIHLGSWRRVPEEGGRSLTYRELAHWLPDYLERMGFTHVEMLPPMEHPFYGSWGYHVTGYFAPTARYGTPQDFMHLIDVLHQHGIGVILDWVPAHFPSDEHALGYFDGTHLYEHHNPQLGFHPDWKSLIFNFGRNEVRCFLISNAMFWLEKYHVDGLRVDAVASMLYLDYSRKEGEWVPNYHGGRENLGALAFMRDLNSEVYRCHPDVQMIAEESTAWPMVSRPTYLGGLGFGLKWDMGWMHDTLSYLRRGPVHRSYHHNDIIFRMIYAFNENFVLPLSHDEVVHGKGSLLDKMPGDDWQRFANLRLLYGYMYGQPGKKLLFMGGEIAQWREWSHETSLDWGLLQFREHAGMQKWLTDLNQLYRHEPALHELDCQPLGFEWIDCSNWQESALAFLRRGRSSSGSVIIACNFTPVPRLGYRVGVPQGGFWKEVLNSDSEDYGGSGVGNFGGVMAENVPHHGRPYSLSISLPPLATVYFKSE